MRILVADTFPAFALSELQSLGVAVDHRPDLKAEQLPQAAEDASVIIVRGKKVSGEVFERARELALVIRAGAGVNTIDVAAASRRGVYVANCPGQNAIAVAELAFGLVLALDRRIPDNVTALREGRWEKKRFSEARGLFGRTLGVAGLGAIGREVVRRGQAFGMEVVGWSRSLDDAGAQRLGIASASGLEDLAARSDVFSLHLPLVAQTRGVVSRGVLSALRDGALFVNTARAELVDQDALLEEARSGRLRVATDVFAGEPEGGKAEFRSELALVPGVYGTHHIGASTEQAQDAIAREAVRIVERFLRAGEVPNCVNVARKTPARGQLIVRHFDRVGVLASVLDLVREARINAQEIENTIFAEAVAASCKIQLDEFPGAEVLERIRACDGVISATWLEL